MSDILRSRETTSKKKIALLFWPKVGNQHLHLVGIRQFAVGFSHWVWRGFAPVNSVIPLIRAWRPDGIIGMIETSELARVCRCLRVPAIDVGDRLAQQSCIQIGVDHKKIGEMAANYFLSRRFENFAFCGVAGAHFAVQRHRSFAETLKEAGMECHTAWFNADAGVPQASAAWIQPNPKAAKWIAKLPKPLALLASCDQNALMIMGSCSVAGIRVPDDVAVLGVDDDELMCAMANPTLSSIPFPAKRIGYEAAAVLEAMMNGESAPDEPVVFPPLPIVTRGSTERVTSSDPDVARALDMIRANIGKRFKIIDLVDNLGVSRRALERKFHRELSTGIQAEIRRARVELARVLLRETDLTLRTIAAKCGFSNLSRLGVVFRQYTDTSPAAYRKQFQSK